jgi:glycosyltransferase involved in cell wall biosynthesis
LDLTSDEGPHRVVRALIREWQKSGNEITVVTGRRQKAELPGVLYNYRKVNMFLYRILRFFVWLPVSRRELGKFDVIIDEGHTLPLLLIRKLLDGPPVYFHSHQNLYLFDCFNANPVFSRIRSFFLDCLAVKLSSWVIAVSEMHKKSLAALYGNEFKIRVIQNGVSLSEFRSNGSRRANFALFVGNMRVHLKSKGIPTLLKAFSLLAKSLDDCGLVVAGKPNSALDSISRDLGIDGRVHYAGLLDRQRLVEYYNRARVLVLPSIMDADPLVVKEAMACGTPVIVSKGVGSSDLIEAARAGMIFPVGDYLALYSRLVAVMSDEKLASELGNNGHSYAEVRLGWDKIAKAYLDMFLARTQPAQMTQLLIMVAKREYIVPA